MANKERVTYICGECGYESAKWMGKCPQCESWNTMTEFAQVKVKSAPVGGTAVSQKLSKVVSLPQKRVSAGMGELDRVLGGGAVHGSFVLVGGEPGIGKSTLLLQMCDEMCKNAKVLYVSGEESLRQIKLRAKRLCVSPPSLFVLAETDMDQIIAETDALEPDILIVDSIQTVYRPDVSAAPGGASQIKECAMALMQYAKSRGVTIFIIGHVNKEGALAGPKILEHMVDCVLYFEGETSGSFRCLRAAKNRYGSTNEIGVFEMTDTGLVEVPNPSVMLLSGRPKGVSGTCVTCTIEGSRPILAEVQGLATQSGYGNARRRATGFDYNRLSLLLAVLEKRAGYYFSNNDAYINIVGGLRIDEPAIDLAVAMALISSLKDVPIDENVVVFGEIGLAGEIRAVSQAQLRVNEAVRLGFTKIILPYHNLKAVKCDGAELIGVKNIRQAFEAVSI